MSDNWARHADSSICSLDDDCPSNCPFYFSIPQSFHPRHRSPTPRPPQKPSTSTSSPSSNSIAITDLPPAVQTLIKHVPTSRPTTLPISSIVSTSPASSATHTTQSQTSIAVQPLMSPMKTLRIKHSDLYYERTLPKNFQQTPHSTPTPPLKHLFSLKIQIIPLTNFHLVIHPPPNIKKPNVHPENPKNLLTNQPKPTLYINFCPPLYSLCTHNHCT